MTRKRAFTMVEMMLAVSMTAVLMGTITAVYAYTIERMGYGLADASTQREAEYALGVISATVSKAQSCSLISSNGNACLKCTMPANCSDGNGDQILDVCTPDAINRRSLERWGNGNRVWFYLSDTSALPSTFGGNVLWMARRSDDGTPTATDTVSAFTYFPGNTKLRLDLIQSMTIAAGSTTNQITTTINVGAYGGRNGQAAPSTAGTDSSYQFSLTRTAYMHGWRI